MSDPSSESVVQPWLTPRSALTAAAFSRGDRSRLGVWFATIDKLLLTFVIALIGCGVIAVAAASPAAASPATCASTIPGRC